MAADADKFGDGEALHAASEVCGPNLDQPVVIALTGGATDEIDLEDEFKNLKRLFTLRSEGSDFWFAFSNTASEVLDPTAVGTTSGRCAFVPAKERYDAFPTGRYLLIWGTAGDIFRVYPSSNIEAAK